MTNVSNQEQTALQTKFTTREKEILHLICDGHTTDEIASKLYLSIHTVNSHRANMIVKTGARNTVQMVARSLRNST